MDILEAKGECSQYDCYMEIVNKYGEEVGMPDKFVDYDDVRAIIEEAYQAICDLDGVRHGNAHLKAYRWMAKHRPDTRF